MQFTTTMFASAAFLAVVAGNHDVSTSRLTGGGLRLVASKSAPAFDTSKGLADARADATHRTLLQDGYSFEDGDELELAVNLWCDDTTTASARAEYGDISKWDTSLVTDMRDLFQGKDLFDDDISGWNVSSVMYMMGMFYGASSFNQDISGWDVASVRSMVVMFMDASLFNYDISAWNVTSVMFMAYMFSDASSFNQLYGPTFSI